PDSAAFLESLQELEKRTLNFRLIPPMTATDNPHGSWNGETGSISKQMLSKYLPRLQGAICYVAGSPHFVNAMLKLLTFTGVGEEVRCEQFVGYLVPNPAIALFQFRQVLCEVNVNAILVATGI